MPELTILNSETHCLNIYSGTFSIDRPNTDLTLAESEPSVCCRAFSVPEIRNVRRSQNLGRVQKIEIEIRIKNYKISIIEVLTPKHRRLVRKQNMKRGSTQIFSGE